MHFDEINVYFESREFKFGDYDQLWIELSGQFLTAGILEFGPACIVHIKTKDLAPQSVNKG